MDSTPELISPDDYKTNEAEFKAGLNWLLSQSTCVKDSSPVYIDKKSGQEFIRPTIVRSLVKATLYKDLCKLLFDTAIHNHADILELLRKANIEVKDDNEKCIKEELLSSHKPIQLQAHIALQRSFAVAFLQRQLSIDTIVKQIRTFTGHKGEVPSTIEDALLLWISKCCESVQLHLNTLSYPKTIPVINNLNDDLSDGCCLAVLISYYCPKHIALNVCLRNTLNLYLVQREVLIIVSTDISHEIEISSQLNIANSLHNISLVCEFMRLHLDINYLTVNDVFHCRRQLSVYLLTMITSLYLAFEGDEKLSFVERGYSLSIGKNLSAKKSSDIVSASTLRSFHSNHKTINSKPPTVPQPEAPLLARRQQPPTSPPGGAGDGTGYKRTPVRRLHVNQSTGSATSYLDRVSMDDEDDDNLSSSDSDIDIDAALARSKQITATRLSRKSMSHLGARPVASVSAPFLLDKTPENCTNWASLAHERNTRRLHDNGAGGGGDGEGEGDCESEVYRQCHEALNAKRVEIEQRRKHRDVNRHRQFTELFQRKYNEKSCELSSSTDENQMEDEELMGLMEAGGEDEVLSPGGRGETSYTTGTTTNRLLVVVGEGEEEGGGGNSPGNTSDSDGDVSISDMLAHTNNNQKGFSGSEPASEPDRSMENIDKLNTSVVELKDEILRLSREQKEMRQAYFDTSEPSLSSSTSSSALKPRPQSGDFSGSASPPNRPPQASPQQEEHLVTDNFSLRVPRYVRPNTRKIISTPTVTPRATPTTTPTTTVASRFTLERAITPSRSTSSDSIHQLAGGRKQHRSPALLNNSANFRGHITTPRPHTPSSSRMSSSISSPSISNKSTYRPANPSNLRPFDPPTSTSYDDDLHARLGHQQSSPLARSVTDIGHDPASMILEPQSLENFNKLLIDTPVKKSLNISTDDIESMELSTNVGFSIDESSKAAMHSKRQKVIDMQSKREQDKANRMANIRTASAKKNEANRLKEQELSMKKAAGKERRDQIYKDYMRKKDAVSPPITGRHPGAATCRSPASGYHDHTGQDHTDTSTAAAATSRQNRAVNVKRNLFNDESNEFVPHRTESSTRYNKPSSSHDKVTTRAVAPIFSAPSVGPKLYVQPSSKSNKHIIMNAITHRCLAGTVHKKNMEGVLQIINDQDCKHFIIMFRDGNLQYRGLYSYMANNCELTKLHGVGPKQLHEKNMEFFYKYNCGSKNFTQVTSTKHISATIDAVSVYASMWSKRAPARVVKVAEGHY